MEKNLKLIEKVSFQMLDFFKKEKREKIAVIYLQKKDEAIFGNKFVPFQENSYISHSFKSVSLKTEALKKCIIYAIENHYDGLLLVHNHPAWIPFFSNSDIKTFKATIKHLQMYGYPLIHGIGVVTKERMGTRFDSIFVKSDFYKKIADYI